MIHDYAVLLLAFAAIFALFKAIEAGLNLIDRFRLRRAIGRAHQPRPFDWQREDAG